MTDIPTPWYMEKLYHHHADDESDEQIIGGHILEAIAFKRTLDDTAEFVAALIAKMLDRGTGPEAMAEVRAEVRKWNERGKSESRASWEPNEVRMLYLLSCAYSVASDGIAEVFDFARAHVDAAQLAEEQQ